MSRVPGSERRQSAVTPILCASDLQENKSRSDVPTNSAAKRQAVSAVPLGAERPIPDSRPNFHACVRNTTADDRRQDRDTCMHKLSIVIGSDKILRAQHIKENTALTMVFSVRHGYQRRLMLRHVAAVVSIFKRRISGVGGLRTRIEDEFLHWRARISMLRLSSGPRCSQFRVTAQNGDVDLTARQSSRSEH